MLPPGSLILPGLIFKLNGQDSSCLQVKGFRVHGQLARCGSGSFGKDAQEENLGVLGLVDPAQMLPSVLAASPIARV